MRCNGRSQLSFYEVYVVVYSVVYNEFRYQGIHFGDTPAATYTSVFRTPSCSYNLLSTYTDMYVPRRAHGIERSTQRVLKKMGERGDGFKMLLLVFVRWYVEGSVRLGRHKVFTRILIHFLLPAGHARSLRAQWYRSWGKFVLQFPAMAIRNNLAAFVLRRGYRQLGAFLHQRPEDFPHENATAFVRPQE